MKFGFSCFPCTNSSANSLRRRGWRITLQTRRYLLVINSTVKVTWIKKIPHNFLKPNPYPRNRDSLRGFEKNTYPLRTSPPNYCGQRGTPREEAFSCLLLFARTHTKKSKFGCGKFKIFPIPESGIETRTTPKLFFPVIMN